MKSRFLPSLVVLAALAAPMAAARADETSSTIKLSDPSKPGTLKINVMRGDLRIEATDGAEIVVKSDVKASAPKQRNDGLRVISSASSFALTEKDNIVTLDAASHEFSKVGGDFRITVPRNTSVVVQNGWGGEIACVGLAGDIEINSMRGEIKLEDIAGGAVVSTMSGEIHASVRALSDRKPLSFTSMNGEVVVRVPENAKANVNLRTQNGSVLTDFEESALVTRTESTPGLPRGRTGFIYKGAAGGKVLSAEIQDAIRDATQISATAVKEALEAIKEGLEAARLNADEARRQFEEARREMDRARSEADRQRRQAEREQRASTPRAPMPPAVAGASGGSVPAPPAVPAIAAKIAAPTITGGKLVTGTLNGGGPEISVATMNGDVILRRLESKK